MSQSNSTRKGLKQLQFDSLTKWLKGKFKRIKDKRGKNSSIELSDSLLSGFAMYSLKDPSLLFFNNKRSARRANLKKVYKIDQAPSDSGMRTILDEVSPLNFKGVFRGLVGRLRKAGYGKRINIIGAISFVV